MNPLEPYYQIVSGIYGVSVTLFDAFCYVLWVRPFVQEGKDPLSDTGRIGGGLHNRLHRTDLGFRMRLYFCGRAVWCGIAYAVTMIFLQQIPFYIPNVLAFGIGDAAAFLIMCLADRRNLGQKVFLAVTFYCMRWQSWEVWFEAVTWLYQKWVSFLLSTEGHESLSFLYVLATESYEFWFYVYIVECIVDVILGAVLLYGAVRMMLRVYCGTAAHMKGKEVLMLTVPSVSGMIAYGVLQFYRAAYEKEAAKSVYDLPGHSLVMILYGLICYTTILVIVYIFRKWKQEQEEDEQRRVFTAQMQEMQSHIAEVERLYSDMRRLRHDMGNHLMTLEQLYRREAYEEAGRYAGTLQAEMENVSPDIKSGNPVTDAILSGRKKEMEEQGISFICDFHYPQKARLDAFDLSIILNNALNNTIEAVRQEQRREIYLTSRRVKNMYMIEVANSFTGELHIDEKSGLPITTKAEEGHGFGLAGIRHTAQKYYGDVEIGVEDREGGRCCVLQVMLQMPLS